MKSKLNLILEFFGGHKFVRRSFTITFCAIVFLFFYFTGRFFLTQAKEQANIDITISGVKIIKCQK
jgi:hypothetical protein